MTKQEESSEAGKTRLNLVHLDNVNKTIPPVDVASTNVNSMGQLREAIHHKIYHGLTMAEADHYTDWVMQLITTAQLQLVTEARRKAFRELPAVLSLNSTCNHCHANLLTLKFLGSDSPEDTTEVTDLVKNSPETIYTDTLSRPGEHKKQELERLQ